MPSSRAKKSRRTSTFIRENARLTEAGLRNKISYIDMDLTPDSPIIKIDMSKIDKSKIKVIPRKEVLAKQVLDITELAQMETPKETFNSVVRDRQNAQKTEFLEVYRPDNRKRVQRESNVEMSGPSGARGHKYYSR